MALENGFIRLITNICSDTKCIVGFKSQAGQTIHAWDGILCICNAIE